jgi:hypothetical protein
MNVIRPACILVIADPGDGQILHDRLGHLKQFKVNRVDHVEEARRICAAGAADACLLVVRNSAPEDLWLSLVKSFAPDLRGGVPSLLVAEVVDPCLMVAARRFGYSGAVSITTTARLLYRSIGAMLQKPRRKRVVGVTSLHTKRPRPGRSGILGALSPPAGPIPPTLH